MQAVLAKSLNQITKINELEESIRYMIDKNHIIFSDEPEDIIRILATIQELTQNQLQLSAELGNCVRST